MLNRFFAIAPLLLLCACGLLDPDTELKVDVEILGVATPPDSLAHLDAWEWKHHPPDMSAGGGAGSLFIEGDYVLPCGNDERMVGQARYDSRGAATRIVVTINYEHLAETCANSDWKARYRAEVGPVEAGSIVLTVEHFIVFDNSVQTVLTDSVFVQ